MSSTFVAGLCLLGLAALLPSGLSLQEISVNSCSDLSDLADAIQDDDVNATVTNNLSCDDEWTTVVVPSDRKLRVEAEKPTWRVKFTNVRFVVEAREASGDWDCTFALNSKFFATIDNDVIQGIQVSDKMLLNSIVDLARGDRELFNEEHSSCRAR